jgi:deoxyribose-phosphate aldolase
MQFDAAAVERLVEQITRQVLVALGEQQARAAGSLSDVCQCKDGQCSGDCKEKVREVVSAGAARITSGLGLLPADASVASMIDHTLLKPDASEAQIAQLCHEARKYNFAAVCVNPAHVRLCAQLLTGSAVRVCTVVGFPLGATPPEVKAYETQQALDDGATEIDMVINIGALKGKDYALVARDIATVVATAHAGGAIVKVIIEAALLSDEEKVIASKLSKEAGADSARGGAANGRQGGRRHSHLRRGAANDRSRRDAHRSQRQRQDHSGRRRALMDIAEIKEKVRADSYVYTQHAEIERRIDGLTFGQVEEALLNGEVLEQYPDTGRGESCLIVGFAKDVPIHAVCGWHGERIALITVYVPRTPKFIDPWTRREERDEESTM